jgi:hypothetical protein
MKKSFFWSLAPCLCAFTGLSLASSEGVLKLVFNVPDYPATVVAQPQENFAVKCTTNYPLIVCSGTTQSSTHVLNQGVYFYSTAPGNPGDCYYSYMATFDPDKGTYVFTDIKLTQNQPGLNCRAIPDKTGQYRISYAE